MMLLVVFSSLVHLRRSQIQAVRQMVVDHRKDMVAALAADLRKPGFEASIMEMAGVIAEADFALANFEEWVKPEPVSTPLLAQPATCWVHPDPLGVVLIIAPWNFPLALLLQHLVGACACA